MGTPTTSSIASCPGWTGDGVTRIVLIRHAEAVSNVRGAWAGHDSCEGITEHGAEHATSLLERLRTTRELDGCTVFMTSRMRRAMETAEILGGAFEPRARFEPDCSFCELHPGALDGDLFDSPLSFSVYGDVFHAPAGGESRFSFARRVRRGLVALAVAAEGSGAVVVTHAGLIGTSVALFGDVDAQRGITTRAPNCSITEWDVSGPAQPASWRLVRYGDDRVLKSS